MDDLLAARSQMAMSLAFHIVFAAVGTALLIEPSSCARMNDQRTEAHWLPSVGKNSE